MVGSYERLALCANRAGIALAVTGAIAFCLCGLDWLFGVWNFRWVNTGLLISYGAFLLGGFVCQITEAPLEEAIRRREEFTFSDQLHKAQWGNLDSMLYIGVAYMRKASTVDMRKSPPPASAEINLLEAEFWFRRATEKRYPRAFYYLARLYWKQRNYEAMRTALEEGAEAGDAPSMSLLGRFLLSGKIYEKDLPKATTLLQAAAAKGNLIAKAGIEGLLLRGHKGLLPWCRGGWIFLTSIVAIMTIGVTKGMGDERLL